tara:strand:- start:128 stop:367 length:240 start_codon:yes stop_codon:yes gene_type:complete
MNSTFGNILLFGIEWNNSILWMNKKKLNFYFAIKNSILYQVRLIFVADTPASDVSSPAATLTRAWAAANSVCYAREARW